MCICMYSYFMPLSYFSFYRFFILPLYLLSDNKKCCFHALTVQNIKILFRKTAWSVIKCKKCRFFLCFFSIICNYLNCFLSIIRTHFFSLTSTQYVSKAYRHGKQHNLKKVHSLSINDTNYLLFCQSNKKPIFSCISYANYKAI